MITSRTEKTGGQERTGEPRRGRKKKKWTAD